MLKSRLRDCVADWKQVLLLFDGVVDGENSVHAQTLDAREQVAVRVAVVGVLVVALANGFDAGIYEFDFEELDFKKCHNYLNILLLQKELGH